MTQHSSVLIVNFNSTELLRECLRALYAGPDADELETIVVDNGSYEFPLTALEDEFPRVTWLPLASNTAFTGGMNRAFEASTGELVLLLNPDTLVERNAIANAVRHLNERPHLAAVGAHLIGLDGRLQREYYRRLPRLRDVPVLLFEPVFRWTASGRRFLMEDERFGRELVVGHVAAAFIMVRRSALGGRLLDPTYFNLLSDLELSRRLRRNGQIAVFDDVRCTHVGGGAGAGTRRIDERLRLYHDLTWGIRRYFDSDLSVVGKSLLELNLVMYWASRLAACIALRPRHTWLAVRTAAAALAGRPPRY